MLQLWCGIRRWIPLCKNLTFSSFSQCSVAYCFSQQIVSDWKQALGKLAKNNLYLIIEM